MFVITKKNALNEYLAWQKPAWDESGYFWTSRETIVRLLADKNVSSYHQFLFNTEEEAEVLADSLGLGNSYEIGTIGEESFEKFINNPKPKFEHFYPGIAIETGL